MADGDDTPARLGTLDDTVAIVTGAGQGIGRGIALALADRGAHVAVVGRTAATLDATVAAIEQRGASAVAIVCDVGERAAVDAMVAIVVGRFGRIDVLVNNAQTFRQSSIVDTTVDDVEVAFRSGPLGTLFTMQACFPQLRLRGGSVVNFGTSAALCGDPSFASYAMAKEAIRALTRVAAREWGQYGIRVNTVCPSAESPLSAAFARDHPEAMEALIASIPLGRRGDPEGDIGRAVAALVSDDLRYLTGATLMLDGGRVLAC